MREEVAYIIAQVGAWEGIERQPHRFGGVEFQLDGREIGHIHSNGLVDIAFSRELHDQLIAEHLVSLHHILPDSTWISFRVMSSKDVDHAIWLFRLAYLRHIILLKRHPSRHIPPIDIPHALSELHLSPALQTIFNHLTIGNFKD